MIEPLKGTMQQVIIDDLIIDQPPGMFAKDYTSLLHKRIIPFPSSLDLGEVETDVEIPVRVWNTYFEHKTLNGMISSDDSVSVRLQDYEVDNIVPSFKTIDAIVTVSTQTTQPTIGDVYFDFGEEGAGLFTVTGTRLIVIEEAPIWAVRPDWSDTPVETLEYLTDIFTAFDGTEQRARLRDDPRLSFTYRFTMNGEERRALYHTLYEAQGDVIEQPVWIGSVKLRNPGDVNVIPCDPEALGVSVDDRVAFVCAHDDFSTRTITAVNADSIELDMPFSVKGEVGTLAGTANFTMQDSINVNAVTDDLSYMRVTFTHEIAEEERRTPAAPALFDGFAVFDFKANRKDDISKVLERKVDYVDFNVSGFKKYDEAQVPFWTQTINVELPTREEQEALKDFIEYVGGRHRSFLIESFDNDLTLAQDIAAGDTSLVVNNSHMANPIINPEGGNYLLIKLMNGERHIIKTTAADIGTTITLSLSAGMTAAITASQIDRISFMNVSRFNSDRFEFKHITDSYSQISLTTRTTANGLL